MLELEWPHNLETWIMWLTYAPLVATSIVGFALAMIKFVEFHKANALAPGTRDELLALVEKQELAKAIDVAESQRTPVTRLVAALLRQAERSKALLTERGEQVGAVITRELEAGLGSLALVASLGPLFGLFGTVVGITIVFAKLVQGEGITGPQQLAGGIGTALYTTIFGLIIGVFATICHRYFSVRLDRVISDMEGTGLDVVERLSRETP